MPSQTTPSFEDIVAEISKSLAQLTTPTVPEMRKIRRDYSRRFRSMKGSLVREIIFHLNDWKTFPGRMFANELLAEHPEAFAGLKAKDILRLAEGLADWASVDVFGCTIGGQAWREGILTDEMILEWTQSPDRWRRRLALVVTVPLNSPARGGNGDTERTLKICQALIDDRDDMVVKALSWALRELSKRDSKSVQKFLDEGSNRVAPRVRREVLNKLKTGLKNP